MTGKWPPSLLDDIRARLPASQVVGRKVALKKSGREWRGLSPFKSEKSPSFFVNDQKGFYHCFASGEHGDIFKFLMRTEGLTFPEAVERLAEEAGVPLPKGPERNPEREDERKRLYDIMEASATFFEAAIRGPSGAHAKKYVGEKRGLTKGTVERFRIGFGPDSKNALKGHLAKLGFSTEDMVLSGMLIGGADIPVAYDRFRNRVMFPITDTKGRVIAFGGRALDADAPAKYLNSPETPLFHKGHVLFNAAKARAAAYDKNRVIAVEGYMDVVALSAAGFDEAVAPLGTALTEDQMKLLWRMAPEPILCFDGDKAGQKAAFRAIDTALPHLIPGKSIRFAMLPDGLDPDDLIRQRGREAMEAALAETRAFADILFEREWASGDWSSPERRASLEKQLFTLVGRILDPQVRGYYADDMRQRLAEKFGQSAGTSLVVHHAAPAPTIYNSGYDDGPPPDFGPAGPDFDPADFGIEPSGSGVANAPAVGKKPFGAFGKGKGGDFEQRPKPSMFGPGRTGIKAKGKWQPPGLLDTPLGASDSLKQSLVDGADIPPLEVLLLRAVLNHPWLIEEQWEEIGNLDFSSAAAKRLRDTLLALPSEGVPLDTGELRAQVTRLGLDKVLERLDRATTHKSDRFAEPDAEQHVVSHGWRHALAMHRLDNLRRALVSANAAWDEEQSDDTLDRILELKRALAEPIDIDDEAA
jgi:DNA primase